MANARPHKVTYKWLISGAAWLNKEMLLHWFTFDGIDNRFSGSDSDWAAAFPARGPQIYSYCMQRRVVNGPTSSGPNPKLIWSPNHARKNPNVKLGMKNSAMLPDYFDYIFVRLRQKVRLRPESSPKFLSTLSLNPARARPEKPGPTYNSDAASP